MLTGLRLENIALIERLELAFEPGFTELTGETGAGKSILLDGLDALLVGGRIEASFSITPPLRDWLAVQEIEVDDQELLLSSDWRLQDERLSSRQRLNGVAMNRAQIQTLRPLLLDLTVQGQTQWPAGAATHRHSGWGALVG